MRVLAINGSMRKERSSTYHMLKPLLEGMELAGAETEQIMLGHLNIKPCLGCFLCWIKSPGKCVQEDDMADVLEKYVQADMIIMGTPLYHYAMSGLLKNFIDRTLPRDEPWLIEHHNLPGLSGHPERYPKERYLFLLSPCGLPEFNHFEALVHYFRYYSRHCGFNYLGEILRPAADSLSKANMQGMFGWYYDLLRQAGEQLVKRGSISPELQGELKRDLFPGGVKAFRQHANQYWAEEMKKFGVNGRVPPTDE
jgi:putative NADPH-quinone reductase